MPRKKLKRFAELKEFSNVHEFPEDLKGKWGSACFGSDKSIILELACGKGDYSLAMAQMFPEKNFIAVDIQGERLWMGAKEALEADLSNLAFLRIYIEKVNQFFIAGEVDEIWITFPDPHPRKGKAKKRLTSPQFLEKYKKILKPGGLLHLKTDDEALFDWSLEVLEAEGCKLEEVLRDIYSQEQLPEILKIQTYFERKHLRVGRKINYLRFQL